MYKVGADIDHSHPEARDDVIKWGKWIIEEVGATGFRFDAVKVCLPFTSTPLLVIGVQTTYNVNVMAAHRQRLHRRVHQDRS